MSEPALATLLEEYRQLRALAAGRWPESRGVRRFRDLTLVPLLGGVSLVIACDSNASIGEKPNDALKRPYSEVGISALKVALMEVLAAGAVPIMIVNALCMEMEPSGRRLIETMRAELARSGFDPDLILTGSTEDNAPTTQSGIGVTVIGLAVDERLRLGRTAPGDAVLCAGIPKDGVHAFYSEHDPDIATIGTVLALARLEAAHEILPVGSKGVSFEAGELARAIGRKFRPVESPPPIDLRRSAGSSTAVLVSTRPEAIEQIQRAVAVPVFVIGSIE